MTFANLLGLGLVTLVFLYLAARLISAAWLKSKRDHDSITTKRN